MGSLQITDNAATTLATGVTALTNVTSIVLTDASKFPVVNNGVSVTTGTFNTTTHDWAYVTLFDASNNVEIVRCIRRDYNSNTLTIVRGTAANISGISDTSCKVWASTTTGVSVNLVAQTVKDAFTSPVTNSTAAATSASAAATSASNAATSASAAATAAASAIPMTQKAAANGVATLDSSGTVVQQAVPVDNSVTNTKMADNSVNTVEIVDGAVTAAKLASNSVTTVKIADDSITRSKLEAKPLYVPVRQCVLSGPTNSIGESTFGGLPGTSTVVASGVLYVTAASGFDAYGQVDRVGAITNPSWSGLQTTGTMYLYLDIAADGTVTTGSTTLQPIYLQGGQASITNGQFSFNTREYVGYLGNGSISTQVHRVFVGEVSVVLGLVTSITWYAMQGKATTPWYTVNNTTNAAQLAYHYLGSGVDYTAITNCKYIGATNAYYANGDIFPNPGFNYNAYSNVTPQLRNLYCTYTDFAGATTVMASLHPYAVGFNAGELQISFQVKRNW